MATVEVSGHRAYTCSDGGYSRNYRFQEGEMTEPHHTRSTGHRVADAHGRTIDLTTSTPIAMHDCPCARTSVRPRPRGRPRARTVVIVAVTLAGGLVVSVLLVVIRDIVTTVASTSVTGLIVKALLAPRRDR
ncbi:hypothetical protein [Streptomyces purpurascens]|uniref:hypothetical protein n=1 Tax=Streptomyces purpurascens TaxID=1924 RepID=UPI0016756F97|nr:hypothetical protein [Streptomyces purpurascens]MCE7051915.1 hypothetical protein [Streptomyces purpurascens]GHA59122.1 hypothetical protein GCM10010303_83430 [Streptomyces purpurascens]